MVSGGVDDCVSEVRGQRAAAGRRRRDQQRTDSGQRRRRDSALADSDGSGGLVRTNSPSVVHCTAVLGTAAAFRIVRVSYCSSPTASPLSTFDLSPTRHSLALLLASLAEPRSRCISVPVLRHTHHERSRYCLEAERVHNAVTKQHTAHVLLCHSLLDTTPVSLLPYICSDFAPPDCPPPIAATVSILPALPPPSRRLRLVCSLTVSVSVSVSAVVSVCSVPRVARVPSRLRHP